MYGQKAALAMPAAGVGIMFQTVWWLFAVITIMFMVVAGYQLLRPNGDRPRP